MKTVLNMFKVKNQESQTAQAATTQNKFSAQTSYQDDYYDDDFDFEESEAEASNDVFEEFTDKVQSLLDDGAIALEIAEEKTAVLEEMDPQSRDYARLVEEIKIAQADARQNFDDAEFLIKKANEILENNAN